MPSLLRSSSADLIAMSARIQPSDSYVLRDGAAEVEDLTSNSGEEPSGCRACYDWMQRRCLILVSYKWFDNLVLAIVMLNSISLACDDPTGHEIERQDVVNIFESVFLGLFTVELILKVIALGCDTQTGYLSSGWNRLDAVIVGLGYLELGVGDAADGFSVLRCCRCLRPLRTINRLPQLKVIINTLLASAPQLFHVVQLCFFVYMMFALIGLQIWYKNVLHMNCLSTVTGSVLLDDGGIQLCNPSSDAVYQCPDGYACKEIKTTPMTSTVSFDNIGTSLEVAFLVASVESWTNVVVYLEDSASYVDLWIVIVWCVCVVLIGGGLCLNLPPAVLKACFSDAAAKDMLADGDSNDANVRIQHQRLTAARVSMSEQLHRQSEHRESQKREALENAALDGSAKVMPMSDNEPAAALDASEKPAGPEMINEHNVLRLAEELVATRRTSCKQEQAVSSATQSDANAEPQIDRTLSTLSVEEIEEEIFERPMTTNPPQSAPTTVSDDDLLRMAEQICAETPVEHFNATNPAPPPPPTMDPLDPSNGKESHQSEGLRGADVDGGNGRSNSDLRFEAELEAELGQPGMNQSKLNQSELDIDAALASLSADYVDDIKRIYTSDSLNVEDELEASRRSSQSIRMEQPDMSTNSQSGQGCGTGSGTGAEQHQKYDSTTPIEIFNSKDLDSNSPAASSLPQIPTNFKPTAGADDVQRDLEVKKDLEVDKEGVDKEEVVKEEVSDLARRSSSVEEEEIPPPACDCGISAWCHSVVLHIHFANAFFLLITLNTIVLTIDSNDLNEAGESAMAVLNWIFTVSFTIEFVLKLIAFGKLYFYDSLNIFDFFIVMTSWAEIVIKGGGSSSTSVLRMLRVLRLARLLKVIRMSRSIAATRIILTVLVAMLPTLQYIGLLVMLMSFVFAILGMGLFGGQMSVQNAGVPDSNFDNFGWAFLTTFQLVTLEDWPVVFESVKNATNWASIIYVLAVVITGNFVLLKLMLAIMLAFFEEPDMAAKITQEGALISGGGVKENLGMDPLPDVEVAPTIKHLEEDPDYQDNKEIEVIEEAEEHNEESITETYEKEGCMGATQRWSLWFVVLKPFSRTIELMIVTNCVFMAIDPNQTMVVLTIIDTCFTGVFVFEQVLKVLAYSFPIYIKDAANKLDMFVVSVSLLSLCLTDIDIGFVKAIRAVRVIRPLRLVIRSEGMMLVASSLLQSLPGMLNVMVVCVMAWLVFGILGMEFFKTMDKGFCSNGSQIEAECVGYTINRYGTMVDNKWYETDAKFTNTMVAWLTLFQVSSLEGWVDIMYFYVLHPDSNYLASMFFVVWVIISNWFLVNLCVGVIWINYQAICEKHQGWAFLTEEQREWVTAQRRALLLEPTRSVLRPYRVDYCRRMCYDIATNKIYRHFISLNIVLNITTIAVTHYRMTDTWKNFVVIANFVFSCNFFVEAILKIAGFRWEGYWRDGWNRFEFILALYVFGDLAVMIITFMPDIDIPDTGPVNLLLKMVILTRCLRIVRLMKNLRGVTTMLYTLYRALPAVGNIGLLLCVLLYMYAVAGVILFQDVLAHGGISHIHNFTNFGNSCWTIFLICTGDVWPDLMYNCMYTGEECSSEDGNCGTPFAAVYFVTLVSTVTFLLLNMFVTILVDQFIEARRVFMGRVTMSDLDKFRKMWSFYDREGLGYIAPHHLSTLLIELPLPLGLDAPEDQIDDINYMRGFSLKVISELELTDYDGRAHFAQVLYKLSERAHAEDIVGFDNEAMSQMVEDQRKRAIPESSSPESTDGFKNTIDERLAASVVIRHIWRKNYISNLKKGIIPAHIAVEFRDEITESPESMRKACEVLLKVCYIVWEGFPEGNQGIDMSVLKWGADGVSNDSDEEEVEGEQEEAVYAGNGRWLTNKNSSPKIMGRGGAKQRELIRQNSNLNHGGWFTGNKNKDPSAGGNSEDGSWFRGAKDSTTPS